MSWQSPVPGPGAGGPPRAMPLWGSCGVAGSLSRTLGVSPPLTLLRVQAFCTFHTISECVTYKVTRGKDTELQPIPSPNASRSKHLLKRKAASLGLSTPCEQRKGPVHSTAAMETEERQRRGDKGEKRQKEKSILLYKKQFFLRICIYFVRESARVQEGQ